MRDKEVRPSALLEDMIRAHQEHPRREMVYLDRAPEPPQVEHIVDYWDSVIACLLLWAPRRFRRVPQALCGELMWADPNWPELPPYPQTPYCPACLEVDGRDSDTIAATVKRIRGFRI
ncbi:hypothetical protein ACWEO2_39915 [Nocardia sp. NPDC004278]